MKHKPPALEKIQYSPKCTKRSLQRLEINIRCNSL